MIRAWGRAVPLNVGVYAMTVSEKGYSGTADKRARLPGSHFGAGIGHGRRTCGVLSSRREARGPAELALAARSIMYAPQRGHLSSR